MAAGHDDDDDDINSIWASGWSKNMAVTMMNNFCFN
jgi:hypothetical protein